MTRRAETPSHDGDKEKGDAPLIGLVLLFGMVFAGAALVALSGMALIDSLEGQSTGERSLQQAEQLRSDLSSAQFSGERVSLATEHGETWVEQDGTIEYQLNPNDPDAASCSVTREMGTIMYNDDGHEVALQAGGVFEETESGSRMISPPSLEHEQLDSEHGPVWMIRFPPVNISTNDAQQTGSIAYYNEELSSQEQEAIREGLCLPAHEHSQIDQVKEIKITIEGSSYQEGWYRFLQDELSDESIVEQDGDTVSATLPLGLAEEQTASPEHFEKPPAMYLEEYGSVVSTVPDTFEFHQGYTDGYDSSDGPYNSENRMLGNIVAHEDLRLSGDSEFYADGCAGGEIFSTGSVDVGGELTENCDVGDPPEPITDEIIDVVSIVSDYNTNDQSDVIDPDSKMVSDPGTLETGVYYLTDGTIDEQLTLDTSDGDIVIAVDDDLTFEDTVEIVGSGPDTEVRWFIDGEITVNANSHLLVEDDRSVKNLLFPTEMTTIEGESRDQRDFVGLIYSPGTHIIGTNEATVMGALVGDVSNLGGSENPGKGAENHLNYHYDHAIEKFATGSDEHDVDYGDITVGNTSVISGVDNENIHALDWEITLMGSEFGLADADADETFSVDLPIESIKNEGALDRLEYWQTASGEMAETRNGKIYDEITFEGTKHDLIEIDLDSNPQHSFELLDPDGDTVSPVGNSEYELDKNGDYTIVISSSNEQQDTYKITLKRIEVQNAPTYKLVSTETNILLEDDGELNRAYPWPQTNLEEASMYPVAVENNTNHAASIYPKKYNAEKVPAQTNMSVEVLFPAENWDALLCDDHTNFAGNHRIDPDTNDVYFLQSCADETAYEGGLGSSLNAIEDINSERIKILEDGDQVPPIEALEGQKNLRDILGDRIVESETGEDAYEMDLGENEYAAVFDYSPYWQYECGGDRNDLSGEYDTLWDCAIDTPGTLPDFNNLVILFEVTDVHPATEYEIEVIEAVEKGDEVDFEVTVENVVDDSVTIPVGLEIGHVDEEQMLELEPGESVSHTFRLDGDDTRTLDVGTHDWTVSVGGVERSSELTVVPEGETVEEGDTNEWEYGTEIDDYSYTIEIDGGVITVEDE
ncbi:hypothetical protein ACLI4R_07520 [Natrialbaceae archaeon A-chndr2]